MTKGQHFFVDKVVKSYGPIKAVDEVSLDVEPGEFLTLLGPSGSGKTTLLMMIAGFVTPNSGSIRIGDNDITRTPPELRNFGMVFQGYALFPHLSVYDNVAFPLKIRRRTPQEIKLIVDTTLSSVQMSHLAERYPRELSGGQQQRVALSRAMCFNPNLLLLDEPLGALDRKLRAEVQIEIKKLHQRLGMTFIYVTHDQEEALSMSDRIAIFRHGRVAQIGSPEALYEKPRTRFVASFLGESDFISGRISSVRNGIAEITTPAGQIRQNGEKHPAAGSQITIALRPEKVTLYAEMPANSSNSLRGHIVAWRYLGGRLNFEIDVEGVGILHADVAASAGQRFLQQGSLAWIGWYPQDGVTVLDE